MPPFAYAFVLGALSKLLDNRVWPRANLGLAAVAAYCLGMLFSFNPQASSVFLGIALGNLLAGKVDAWEHALVLAGGFGVGLFLGFQWPLLLPLAVAGFFALLDEEWHERLAVEQVPALRRLGQWRLALPFSLLLLSLSLNDWSYFAYGLLFDVSYRAAAFLFPTRPRKALPRAWAGRKLSRARRKRS